MAGPGPFPVPMTMETSMIERLDTATLRSLTGPRTGPCVTLLLPTEHGPRGADAGKLGLKNLVAAARDELHGRIGSLQVDELLAPVEAILVEDSFWHELGEGLACFLAPDLPGGRIARVPRPTGAFSYVGDRFAVTPLLPGFLPDAGFHLLALSRNHTHVFRGDRHSITAVRVPDLPDGLEDALWFEGHDNLLNRHAGSRMDSGGRPTAVVHGVSASDTRKEQFDRYARLVDDAVVAALGQSRLPLVVAAVERELATYREVSRYPDVVAGGIPGSPDRTALGDLHAAAWALVERRLAADDRAARERFAARSGSGSTETDPVRLAELAATGGLDTVFVVAGAHCWVGTDGTRHETRAAGDRDLVNEIVTDALRSSATVFPAADLHDLVTVGAEVPMVAALVRPGR